MNCERYGHVNGLGWETAEGTDIRQRKKGLEDVGDSTKKKGERRTDKKMCNSMLIIDTEERNREHGRKNQKNK